MDQSEEKLNDLNALGSLFLEEEDLNKNASLYSTSTYSAPVADSAVIIPDFMTEPKENVASFAMSSLGVVKNGTAGNNFLTGTSGNDTINGLGGNDQLYGAGGNDRLSGGFGNDYVYGEDGNDVLIADEINNGAVQATYDGDNLWDGNDFLTWQRNVSNTGTNSSDGNRDGVVNGADLTIWENNFGSESTVSNHVDVAFIDSQNYTGNFDYLIGGNGDDVLYAGGGNDFLWGDNEDGTGTGKDTFVLTKKGFGSNNLVTIRDFSMVEGDVLDISNIIDYSGTGLLSSFVQIMDGYTSGGGVPASMVAIKPQGTGAWYGMAMIDNFASVLPGTTTTEAQIQSLVANGTLIV